MSSEVLYCVCMYIYLLINIYIYYIISYLFAELKILAELIWLSLTELHWSDLFFTFYSHANFTPSVFLGWKTSQSPTYWPVSLPLTHMHRASLANIHLTPPQTHKGLCSRGVPWCTVMEPPGGLRGARITERLVVVSQWGLCSRHSFEVFLRFPVVRRKLFVLMMWDLKEIKEMASICFLNTLLTSAFI